MRAWFKKLLDRLSKRRVTSTADFDMEGYITVKSISPILTGALNAGNPSWTTSSTVTTSSVGASGPTFSFPSTPSFQILSSTPNSIITLYDQGKEIVRLNKDGSATWNDEINVDKAAEAFSTSLQLGTELCAGITERVRLQLRDRVFAEIIAISRDKGFLTTEDLTYMLEASKIIEKLKGMSDK